MTGPIGTFSVPASGDRPAWTATLTAAGRWSVPASPPLAGVLDALFSPRQSSPADGVYGRKVVADAAAHFGGTARFPANSPPSTPAGRVH